MGRTKASVLPEPVGDSARTSWPASASGMTSDWTAKGSAMPRRARAPVAADDTPRSANVGDGIWVLLLLCGAGDSTDPDHAGAHSKAQTSRAAAPPMHGHASSRAAERPAATSGRRTAGPRAR